MPCKVLFIGDGLVGITTYAIPIGALPFWKDRLTSFDIVYKEKIASVKHYCN